MADVQPDALPLVTSTSAADVFIKQNGSTGVVEQVTAANMIPAGSVGYSKQDFTTWGKGSVLITGGTISSGTAIANGAVTITVGASGAILVGYSLQAFGTGTGFFLYTSVALSGGNTLAVNAATNRLYKQTKSLGVGETVINVTQLLTGLSSGSTTFTFNNWVANGNWTINGAADAMWVMAF